MRNHLEKRKHIDLRYNYIMQLEENGSITHISTRTTEMRADFATKNLFPGALAHAITVAELFKNNQQ